MSNVVVSVVLPAYNEATTIGTTVETTLETLSSFLPAGSFEVLVAEDGCDDRTPEIVAGMANADSRVRHIHSEERLGRGGALEVAFRAAEGDTLAYFDTDLATDMSHLEELIESVRAGDADVVTGSRWMEGNVADRPTQRSVLSRGYNTIVRTMLGSSLRDHQCGFKAFDREALFSLLPEVGDAHWFWDTEVLVRAQRAGYQVKEFPVEWTAMGDTKVNLVRDVFGMGTQIVRTWWELAVQPRITRRVSLGAGILLAVAALGLMVHYLPVEDVLEAIESANVGLLGLAGALYVVSWPLRGIRYRDILSELGFESSAGFMTGAVFVSQTGNLVIPARAGDAIRAYIVKTRRKVPYPSGVASLAVERVFDLLTITVLATGMLVVLAATGATSLAELGASITGGSKSGKVAVYAAATIAVLAVFALVVILASARSDRNVIRGTVGRVTPESYADRIVGAIEGFAANVQVVTSDRTAFVRVAGSSLAIWTIDVLTALIVFVAFGTGLSLLSLLGVCFFAVSVGNLAKVLPLSPGGIGLYEGAFAVLVVALAPGLTTGTAIAIAIVDHAVKNLVTVLGGGVSMTLLNVSLTTAVEESRDLEAEPTGDPASSE